MHCRERLEGNVHRPLGGSMCVDYLVSGVSYLDELFRVSEVFVIARLRYWL